MPNNNAHITDNRPRSQHMANNNQFNDMRPKTGVVTNIDNKNNTANQGNSTPQRVLIRKKPVEIPGTSFQKGISQRDQKNVNDFSLRKDAVFKKGDPIKLMENTLNNSNHRNNREMHKSYDLDQGANKGQQNGFGYGNNQENEKEEGRFSLEKLNIFS